MQLFNRRIYKYYGVSKVFLINCELVEYLEWSCTRFKLVSILLYGCTTLILTKRSKKKLDGNRSKIFTDFLPYFEACWRRITVPAVFSLCLLLASIWCIHTVGMTLATAWKKFRFILSDRSDFHMFGNQSTPSLAYINITFSRWDTAAEVRELVY